MTFVYVALRAVHVPLTHDEAASYFQYVVSGAFQPGYAHWDAGNHLLSTALGHLSYLVFGMAPIALRLFSVLSFVLYAYYVWRMGKWVDQTLVRVPLCAALILTPFILEFFSLFRGYGLALAFAMMGFFHLVRYADTRRWPHLVGATLGWCLAGFASLTMLLFWMQALFILAVIAIVHVRSGRVRLLSVGWLMVAGAVPMAYAIWYGTELNARDMLYYGSSLGLVNGTLSSLCRLVLGSEHVLMRLVMLVVVVLSVGVALMTVWDRKVTERSLPLCLLSLCLVGELAGRWVLGEARDVLYPIDRTAAHLVPLSLLIVALAMDRVAVRIRALRYAGLALFFLPVRIVAGLNVERTVLWPEEAMAEGLIQEVEERQARTERPLLISAWSQFPDPWLYARAHGHPTLPPLIMNGFPLGNADLLLLDTLHNKVPSGFRTVYRSSDGVLLLAEREKPLRLDLVADSVITRTMTSDAFIGLWEIPKPHASGRPLLVELSLCLTTQGRLPHMDLVSDAHGADGQGIMYEAIDLDRVHTEWRGDTLRCMLYFPAVSPPDRSVVYLWMVNGRSMEVKCTTRTYTIGS